MRFQDSWLTQHLLNTLPRVCRYLGPVDQVGNGMDSCILGRKLTIEDKKVKK
jgi:hypothetical protein